MTVADKLQTIAENQQKVYDAGKSKEWSDFWDEFQQKGSKGNYVSAFCGTVWTIKNFRPKYDLKPISSGYRMFFQMTSGSLANLEQVLIDLGIKLDLSRCIYLTGIFSSSYITHLPKLEILSSDNTTDMCNDCKRLVSIRELVLKDTGTNQFSNTFKDCIALKDIVVSGVIGNNIDFGSCPLTKASIESIFNALSATTSGKTATFNKSAVNTAFETSAGLANGSNSIEWETLKNTKSNWTISLI